MLTRLLYRSRHYLHNSQQLNSFLRRTGVAQAGRRVYEKRILATGQMHALVFGHRLRLAVESRREIRRINSFDAEEDFVAEILEALRPGDVVWDIGANIGLISLVLAKSCEVTVHAFEPEPRNLAHLRRNITLNGLDGRVHAHPVAIGDREGEIKLYVGGETGEGRHSIIAPGMDGARATSVRMTTPSNAIQQFASTPSVVKIDVEGSELLVIRGLTAICPQHSAPREMFVEVHPKQLATQGDPAEAVADELARAGYRSTSSQKRSAEFHQRFQLVGC